MYEHKFEEHVERYNPLMYSIINKTFIDGYDRDDLYQESLMILHNCLNDFDETKGVKFTTFLYTSLTNRMTDLLRTTNRGKRPEIVYLRDDSRVILDIVANNEDTEDSVEQLELVNDITNKLLELPRGYITYLIYIGGMSMEEIGNMEGISKQRVSYINKRNIKQVREMMK